MAKFRNDTGEPVVFSPPGPYPDGTWRSFVVEPGGTLDYPDPGPIEVTVAPPTEPAMVVPSAPAVPAAPAPAPAPPTP